MSVMKNYNHTKADLKLKELQDKNIDSIEICGYTIKRGNYNDEFILLSDRKIIIFSDISAWILHYMLVYPELYFIEDSKPIFEVYEYASIGEIYGMTLSIEQIDNLFNLQKLFLQEKVKSYVTKTT